MIIKYQALLEKLGIVYVTMNILIFKLYLLNRTGILEGKKSLRFNT